MGFAGTAEKDKKFCSERCWKIVNYQEDLLKKVIDKFRKRSTELGQQFKASKYIDFGKTLLEAGIGNQYHDGVFTFLIACLYYCEENPAGESDFIYLNEVLQIFGVSQLDQSENYLYKLIKEKNSLIYSWVTAINEEEIEKHMRDKDYCTFEEIIKNAKKIYKAHPRENQPEI